MTEKVLDELLARWDLVVTKLTELSPKVFGLYVRQAVLVDGVVTALVSVLALCVIGYCFARAIAGYKRATTEYDGTDADIGWSFAIAGLIVVGSIAMGYLVSGAAHLMNPQYYALRALIGTFVK